MKITGSYNNYLNLSNLLTPLGVKNSSDLVMGVFSASLKNLQEKADNEIFSKESADVLKQLYDKVSDLSTEASKLTLNDIHSVFNDRTAATSDTSVLTATALDALSQETGATEATYDISVTQLAQVQENRGLELIKTESSVIDAGTHTFNININGQDHQVGIEVEDGDTNEIVIQKIEAAINEAETGLKAEIIDDSESGTQQLVVRGENAGEGSAFTISDTVGHAISETGSNTVSKEAQDAVYVVDGAENTSSNNKIYLDGGMVTVDLKGEGDASLTVAPDKGLVKSAISTFVSEVNSVTDFLKKNDAYIKEDVLSSINSFIGDHKNELEALGITRGDDGRLEIDDAALNEAVVQKFSEIKETFGSFDGLGVQTNNYASHLATDSPLNYAEEAKNMTPEMVDHIYGSSAGMLSQILQGSLLDNYI